MERDTGLKANQNLSSCPIGHSEPDVELLLDATKEAERVLEQEARIHPTYADVRHRLGLLRLLRNDPEGGEKEFEEALGINPGYRAAFYGLRLARMMQGISVDRIDAKPDAASDLPEEMTWWTIDEAYRLQLEGGEPIDFLVRNQSDPESQINNIYCGVFALKSKDLKAASDWFSQTAETSDVIKETQEIVGLYPWPKSDSQAIEGALQAVLWTPLAHDLYTYLGRIYARNGLRNEGMNCFKMANLVHPHEIKHSIHCAELVMAFGEETEAISLLKSAIESDPSNVQARIALGYEYSSQGFIDEAKTQFQAASNLAPGYADIRYNLALIYVGETQFEEALEEFRAALAINPAYLPARHSMAHLLCRMGQYESGLKEYNRILKQGFKSGDMLVQIGKASMAMGKTDEALVYLEQAIYLNPDFASSYYYLGQAYQRKGMKNKARAAWRNYLERANEWDPLGPVTPNAAQSEEAS